MLAQCLSIFYFLFFFADARIALVFHVGTSRSQMCILSRWGHKKPASHKQTVSTLPLCSSAAPPAYVKRTNTNVPASLQFFFFFGGVTKFPVNLLLFLFFFNLTSESPPSVTRVAFRKPGLQNERHGSRDLRVCIRLHPGGHRCGQVRQPLPARTSSHAPSLHLPPFFI